MTEHFYLPEFNFSVAFHNGAWCLFNLTPDSKVATSTEQIQAVLGWAAANRRKFLEAMNFVPNVHNKCQK